MKNKIKKLNNRERQAFAALCLFKFCKSKSIEYYGLNVLIEHLFSILYVESILEWEQQGGMLEVTGRGDEFPEEMNDLDPFLKEVLFELVERVVEVGLINMYEEDDDESVKFLYQVMEILYNNKVEIPSCELLYIEESKRDIKHVWGTAISREKYDWLKVALLL